MRLLILFLLSNLTLLSSNNLLLIKPADLSKPLISFSYFKSGKDSSERAMKRKINRNARISALCSAVIPGLGQAVNKKWWKIPIIYAAGAGVGYFFLQNHTQYNLYKSEIKYRVDNPNQVKDFPNYTLDNLVIIKNEYRKYRDLATMGLALVYTLNVLDAYVDGHLKKFDMSDNLSLQIAPSIMYCNASPVIGTGIKFKLFIH